MIARRRQGRRAEPQGLRRRLRRARPDAAETPSSRAQPKRFDRAARMRRPSRARSRCVARIRTEFPRGASPDAVRRRQARSSISRIPPMRDEYLDRLGKLLALDAKAAARRGASPSPTKAAKYVAVAMAYDDVIRVADLKTRANALRARARRGLARARPDRLHHRIYASARRGNRRPAAGGLGGWIERRPRLVGAIDRVVNRGRRVRTGTVRWFLALYVVVGLAPLPARHVAPRARARASARPGSTRAPARCRATMISPCRSSPPPAGQGLFRHPCARPVEI